MSWIVQWPDLRFPYTIHEERTQDRGRVLELVEQALTLGVSDLEISTPRPTVAGVIPLYNITAAFNKQLLIPFLGSGVPLSGRPPNTPWSFGCDFLPSAIELARYIAGQSVMPVHYMSDSSNLARVASYFQATNDYAGLANDLQTIFSAGRPTAIHHLLAKECRRPKLIVTTNYDLLMERALDEAGRKYHRVIHYTCNDNRNQTFVWLYGKEEGEFIDPIKLTSTLNPEEYTILYKMHGSIDAPLPSGESADNRFIITEEHYVDFLSRINGIPPVVPTFFTEHFANKCFLFLGYSLEDWNLRVVLHSLGHVLPPRDVNAGSVADYAGIRYRPRQHWAILRNPTAYDQKIWETRNVEIGNIDLNDFVNIIKNQNRLLPPIDLPAAGTIAMASQST